ncbi:hypothetical protein RUM44_002948 [Polyplax serrata]|uniref:Uncharacterized protein n=1 Tax=Polyplax serrata TaxID=468196 RepID=A0ABR1AX53_POLSC
MLNIGTIEDVLNSQELFRKLRSLSYLGDSTKNKTNQGESFSLSTNTFAAICKESSTMMNSFENSSPAEDEIHNPKIYNEIRVHFYDFIAAFVRSKECQSHLPWTNYMDGFGDTSHENHDKETTCEINSNVIDIVLWEDLLRHSTVAQDEPSDIELVLNLTFVCVQEVPKALASSRVLDLDERKDVFQTQFDDNSSPIPKYQLKHLYETLNSMCVTLSQGCDEAIAS